MILSDQPTIFGDKVRAVLSSKEDGSLKFGLDNDDVTLANRRALLEKAGIDINHTSLVGITYDTDDFVKYRIATTDDKAIGMLRTDMEKHVDALVATEPGHALFLPLADCAGAVIYDPVKKAVMVSHLGRHSVEQSGARKSIEYLKEQLGSNPADLLVWISPSVGKATYPLNAFEGKSLREVIEQQLKDAGVFADHIESSTVDTAHDENYYSHSQFLKGKEVSAGRFAIVAMMPAQGEPAI